MTSTTPNPATFAAQLAKRSAAHKLTVESAGYRVKPTFPRIVDTPVSDMSKKPEPSRESWLWTALQIGFMEPTLRDRVVIGASEVDPTETVDELGLLGFHIVNPSEIDRMEEYPEDYFAELP